MILRYESDGVSWLCGLWGMGLVVLRYVLAIVSAILNASLSIRRDLQLIFLWNDFVTMGIMNATLCYLSWAIAILTVFVIFSCDQAVLWMVQSVCPSVRRTFLAMFPSSYHHEIFRSYYQWQKWRPCKQPRSEVKSQGHRGKKNSSNLTQIGRFRTVTPVWIYQWLRNDEKSLK